MLSWISKWILTRLGWTILADLPDVKKYVVIAAPHTSNWDFPLGILYAKSIKLKVYWMGKHTLFRWPYGWFFRAIGGTAIHRETGKNYIAQMAELFERSEQLVLAPGARGHTNEDRPLENRFLLHRPCSECSNRAGLPGFWKPGGRYWRPVLSERRYRSRFRIHTRVLCKKTWEKPGKRESD